MYLREKIILFKERDNNMLEKMKDFFDARLVENDKHMTRGIEGAKEFYFFTAKCLPIKDNCQTFDLGCDTGLELEEYFSLCPGQR